MNSISRRRWWQRQTRVWLSLSALLALAAGCQRDGKSGLSTNAAVAAAAQPELAAGRAYVYALELKSDVEYGEGASLSLSLRSGVELQRLPDPAPGIVALDLTLPRARFEQEPGRDPQFDELGVELERGVVVELEGGKIKALRGAASLSSFATNIFRSVATAFELPLPGDAAAKSWKVDVEDAAGRNTTEFTAQSPGKYGKRKLSYAAASAPSRAGNLELKLTPRVVESSGSMELRDGRIWASSSEERLETELGTSATARAHNRLSLRFETSKPAVLRQRATLELLGAGQPQVSRVDRAALDAAKIGKLTFESALLQLAASAGDENPLIATDSERKAASAKDNAARDQRLVEHNRVFSAMTAILRTQPLAVARAIALIRAGKPTAKLLTDALAAADTATSTAALVELAGDSRLNAELRAAVTHDLSRVETPTPDTLRALMARADTQDTGLIALYGLGTQARHLRDNGQRELAEQAGRLLVERLTQSHETDARVHCLRAIANSGLSTTLPAVLPFLTARSEVVRSAAVEALRLMDAPEVDELISSRLAREESAFVRRAALNAAKARKPSAVLKAAVLAAADRESDDHGRYAAITLLAMWLPQDASLRDALTHIADNDSVPALRDAARAAL